MLRCVFTDWYLVEDTKQTKTVKTEDEQSQQRLARRHALAQERQMATARPKISLKIRVLRDEKPAGDWGKLFDEIVIPLPAAPEPDA